MSRVERKFSTKFDLRVETTTRRMRELLRLYTEEQLIRYARSIGMSEETVRYYMRCVKNGTVAREQLNKSSLRPEN